jgi:hypothetical protein
MSIQQGEPIGGLFWVMVGFVILLLGWWMVECRWWLVGGIGSEREIERNIEDFQEKGEGM